MAPPAAAAAAGGLPLLCRRQLHRRLVGFACSRAASAASAASPSPSPSPDSLAPWDPRRLMLADCFELNRLVSKRQLFEQRVHLGHKAGCRSEWMTPYLFGSRCGVDIIDLEQTAPLLRDALNFTAQIAARGGLIMFVWQGWPALAPLVERHVQQMGEFAYTRPWADPALTDAGKYFDTATRLPDLAVFLSCTESTMLPHPGIATCAKMLIPTVGVCDSNADPRLVTYPVPGNDDSAASVRLYLALFGAAVRRGKAFHADWSGHREAAAASADAESDEAFKDYQTIVLGGPEEAPAEEKENQAEPKPGRPSDSTLLSMDAEKSSSPSSSPSPSPSPSKRKSIDLSRVQQRMRSHVTPGKRSGGGGAGAAAHRRGRSESEKAKK